jgi:hypothetical protein
MRVAASMAVNRQVQRRRLVVDVSPRPSAGVGAPIERGFERSEVEDEAGSERYLPAGGNVPRYVVTPSRVTPSLLSVSLVNRPRVKGFTAVPRKR